MTTWSPTGLEFFIRGTDDRLWQKEFDDGTWRGCFPLGGNMAGDPAALAIGTQRGPGGVLVPCLMLSGAG
jgi:hypothetical protein